VKNGSNEFGVAFSQIMFLQRVLETNENAIIISRHDDIVFEISRPIQMDTLTIVCVDAYSVSEELVDRVVRSFPDTNIIYFGGKWNGATSEARAFCEARNIGLYNAGSLAPALRHEDFGRGPKWEGDQDDPPKSAEA
jgi:hypothetical protein